VSELIVRGWQARLYSTQAQASRLNQWAGSLRFLWNRLLDREKADYQATGKFIWRKQLQPFAVGMKRQSGLEWLAGLPAHAVLDTVARLDGALRRMVSERKAGRKCGFPRGRKKFVNEAGIYCVGQASEIGNGEAVLPKIGRVRLAGGDVPKGRLLAARIWRDSDRWMISAQFECARPEPLPASDVVIGVDLGVSTLVTAFDGDDFEEWTAPKHLRRAQRRLRRAQRALSRRKKGSAPRSGQARRVAAIHRKVRNRRTDLLHQISHRLTAKVGVLKVETLNVRCMARNRHLAMSVADAGMSRLVTFCRYKADWRGRTMVDLDPWFSGSQTCSECGALRPEMKQLSRREIVCGCGNRMDRDHNAAVNHQRYPEERENRAGNSPTLVEIAGQGFGPVPVGEARIPTSTVTGPRKSVIPRCSTRRSSR
jgi:putative transposase